MPPYETRSRRPFAAPFCARTDLDRDASARSVRGAIRRRIRPPGLSREVVKLQGPWQGKRVDPNAITLDYARYSKDGGVTWSDPEPVLGIYDRFALAPLTTANSDSST